MRKVRKTMMKVLGYLIIFLFMMMTAVGSYQIITRYFFNRPSTVSEELLTYSFTWMSLLAAAYVFGKRRRSCNYRNKRENDDDSPFGTDHAGL